MSKKALGNALPGKLSLCILISLGLLWCKEQAIGGDALAAISGVIHGGAWYSLGQGC